MTISEVEKVLRIRQQQLKRKQAKSNNKLFFIPLFIIILFIIYSYNKGGYYVNKDISKFDKDNIVRFFSKQYIMGSWKLDEVVFHDSGIVANVKVPSKLNMDEKYLSNYIKYSLCPDDDNVIWNNIGNNPLYINLYHDSRRGGFVAQCIHSNSAL